MTAPAIQNQRFNPFLSLVLIFGLVMICAGIFQLLAAYLAVLFFDVGSVDSFTSSFERQLQHPQAMIFMQGISALGTFVVPSLIFAALSSKRPLRYFTLDRPVTWLLVGLSIFILLSGQSVVSISAYLNQQLSFPEWMQGLGTWVTDMNTKVDQGYEVFLNIQTIPRLLVMILVAGILPAFGEEFLFRGILQSTFHQWTKNGHVAVWVAAIIFSLIHLQLLNFLPRLLLGAMLGYLFLWSGNLWYSIIAHLFNNCALLIYTYIYLQRGGTLEALQATGDIQWLPSLAATALFAVLLYFFKIKANRPTIYEEGA